MFFPDKIKSIKASDKVLEIGPGATPHFRSDVFLELQYESENERIAQSGHVGILETERPIVYYDGGNFPFADKEFDYVICSHVLEHVPDAYIFLSEVQRVAKMGYLEFPTIYYDYIYNFPEHQLFLFENHGTINWMKKKESDLPKFASIQQFFYRTIELGYYENIDNFKDYFFQGFEWFDTINSSKVDNLEKLTFPKIEISLEPQSQKVLEPDNINYNSISLKKFLKYRIKKFFLKFK